MSPLNVVLQDRMAPTNRYITHTQVALVTAAHLELRMVTIGHHDVHHSTRILLESERLEPEEVLLLGDLDVDQAEAIAVRFENVWVGRLANFTLKLLPHVANLVWLFLHCHLLLEPELEAFVVDEAN